MLEEHTRGLEVRAAQLLALLTGELIEFSQQFAEGDARHSRTYVYRWRVSARTNAPLIGRRMNRPLFAADNAACGFDGDEVHDTPRCNRVIDDAAKDRASVRQTAKLGQNLLGVFRQSPRYSFTQAPRQTQKVVPTLEIPSMGLWSAGNEYQTPSAVLRRPYGQRRCSS